MSSKFIDRDWHKVFTSAAKSVNSEILVITPFIQKRVVEALLANRTINARVITRFNLNDFYDGVSDLDALEFLLEIQAEVKGVRNLHAKAYVVDNSYAIVTSANLTYAALHRNHEFGLVTNNRDLVSTTRSYFESLWDRAGSRLTKKKLQRWRSIIDKVQTKGGVRGHPRRFNDYGTDLGLAEQLQVSDEPITNAPQWFVKLLGRSNNRVTWDSPVFEEVSRAGCHWACTYPKNKRPRNVKDGAVMFMGRMVKKPNDILVFGRAIGKAYVSGRDDASPEDISVRPWKEDWPRYIRVRDAEFVTGSLGNGVSLYGLMNALGSDTFVTTERNARLGSGNTDPMRAYSQQAHVELTEKAASWLNELLNKAFQKHGKIPEDDTNSLDWPD